MPVSTPVQTAIDAKVTDAIVNGVTTVAPSQNAVFDALALKENALGFTPEDVANKDNGVLTTSTTTYPTSNAVKSAVDAKGNITDIQVFTASGTWTKPSGTPKTVMVYVIGAGGGASTNGFNSGAGGNGANGAVVVITYF